MAENRLRTENRFAIWDVDLLVSPERTKSNYEFGEAEKIDEVVGVELEVNWKVETDVFLDG